MEKTGQQHYYLQVAVEAIDNNVETGKHLGANGRELLGNKKTNRNGYVGFLVISENELLTQISLEEETIAEKLKEAKEKVDAGIVSLKDQMGKVADPKADMENVLIRMNDIRTALGTAGNVIRDSSKAYDNILREMEVNRVKGDRVKKISERIAGPLKNIVVADRIDDPANPQTGSLDYAEAAVQNAQQIAEDDVNLKREPNYAAHRETMTEADRKLRKLSFDLNHVLDAMSEGLVESKLVAILADIERLEDQRAKMLEHIRLELIEKQLRELMQGMEPKSPPKKDEKKIEEKKSSQLRPGVEPAPLQMHAEVAPARPRQQPILPMQPSLPASNFVGWVERSETPRTRQWWASLYPIRPTEPAFISRFPIFS